MYQVTFEPFGLAIFDECHHLGAEVFHTYAKSRLQIYVRIVVTPNRKDGLRSF